MVSHCRPLSPSWWASSSAPATLLVVPPPLSSSPPLPSSYSRRPKIPIFGWKTLPPPWLISDRPLRIHPPRLSICASYAWICALGAWAGPYHFASTAVAQPPSPRHALVGGAMLCLPVWGVGPFQLPVVAIARNTFRRLVLLNRGRGPAPPPLYGVDASLASRASTSLRGAKDWLLYGGHIASGPFHPMLGTIDATFSFVPTGCGERCLHGSVHTAPPFGGRWCGSQHAFASLPNASAGGQFSVWDAPVVAPLPCGVVLPLLVLSWCPSSSFDAGPGGLAPLDWLGGPPGRLPFRHLPCVGLATVLSTVRDGNGYPKPKTRWVFTPLGHGCGSSFIPTCSTNG
jgi:hypothetical protein